MKFKVGDIVTVINEDSDYYHLVGEVTDNQFDCGMMGEAYPYQVEFMYYEDELLGGMDRIEIFSDEELELNDFYRQPNYDNQGVDMVNHPEHYTKGIETIDKISQFLEGKDLTPFQGMLLGNSLKYQDRFLYKGNPYQDLQKAIWYLNKLSKEFENETRQEETN